MTLFAIRAPIPTARDRMVLSSVFCTCYCSFTHFAFPPNAQYLLYLYP